MKLIPDIFSILRTWVFKKKLLAFSGRFRRDPEACFYCPEMCRFSCPACEALRLDTVTPRGKMSLLHLAERGYSAGKITGDDENRQWVLEQCSGCGRCTEFCKWENDVASNLRTERRKSFAALAERTGLVSPIDDVCSALSRLRGRVLFCEVGRKNWWKTKIGDESNGIARLLGRFDAIEEIAFPAREWEWGKVGDAELDRMGAALGKCRELVIESPETAWLLAKGLKLERKKLKAEVRLVWQRLFPVIVARAFAPDTVFHESFHLSRLFPRVGYSIPMYERGFMPFHHGWNMIDCGGEGFFRYAHPYHAIEMASRFLFDLEKDGRKVSKIVCQNLSCLDHLRSIARGIAVTYWLDEAFGPVGPVEPTVFIAKDA